MSRSCHYYSVNAVTFAIFDLYSCLLTYKVATFVPSRLPPAPPASVMFFRPHLSAGFDFSCFGDHSSNSTLVDLALVLIT